MAQLLESRVRAFQRDFTGKIITPDDPEYDAARSVWNGAINRRPALIARCSAPAEVVQAIRFGQDRSLEISVRGGGHNFAGSAVCDDGLMIDLSAMRQVAVEPSARRAAVRGGAIWGGVGREVALCFARDFIKTLPEDAASFIAVLSAPPAPFVPKEFHFLPGFALIVVGFGSAEEHGRLIQPVRDAGGQLFELVTPM